MNPAYFETRFRTTKPITGWPAEFVIISAFATTGETWTSQENENADRRLASELVAADVWLLRVTGYSPATGHAEPSWAVELSLDKARMLGLRFHQDAIYHVNDDRLSVTCCESQSELIHVDFFRSRLDLNDE
jgi:hypothetical protein